MWYVKLNGNILPTPYQNFSDCLEACKQIQREMCAVMTEPVFIG